MENYSNTTVLLPTNEHHITSQGYPANLLVVKLLVKLYKPVRGRSSRILPRTGAANPRTTEKRGLQPRGYDRVRIFSAALATNRGRPPYHDLHPSANLRYIPYCSRKDRSRSLQDTTRLTLNAIPLGRSLTSLGAGESCNQHVFET
jgi:hypothetical protein